MSHEMRWAARYSFVDDLWRGRARVFIDPHLHAVLRRSGTGVAQGLDPAVTELVDAMLPRAGGRDPVWVAVSDPSTAAEMSRSRPGATFVPHEAISDVLRRADWRVAMIDLTDVVDAAHRPGMPGEELAGAVADVLAGWGLFDAMRGSSRCVVLVAPVRDEPRRPAGLDYGDVADLVAERLGGGRIFGVYEPPMVAVVDFAENIDAAAPGSVDEDVDDLETMAVDLPPVRTVDPSSLTSPDLDPDGELEEEDVPLVYDNSLGTQEPPLLEFVAVAGGPEFTAMVSDGLSLVELPTASRDPAVAPGVRAQLSSARRRADEAEIERQTQLERADELEREIFALRRQLDDARISVAELEAELARAPLRGSEDREREALDAALAREQGLRWQVSQLQRDLTAAQARPIEELEAEVAQLRAQLEVGGAPAPAAAPAPTVLAGPPVSAVRSANGNGAHGGSGLATQTTQAVIRAMDGLVRRIERGGIGTLQLRRELVALRRRLQN